MRLPRHTLEASALHTKTFVRQGQRIALVGQRIKNGIKNPRAMLHLELFTDVSRTAPLDNRKLNGLSQSQVGTLKHPTFQRRDDLKDPTELLESAELYKSTPGVWPEKWPEAWPDHLTFSNQIMVAAGAGRQEPGVMRRLLLGAPIQAEKR